MRSLRAEVFDQDARVVTSEEVLVLVGEGGVGGAGNAGTAPGNADVEGAEAGVGEAVEMSGDASRARVREL